MTTKTERRCFSADSHIIEPHGAYRDRIDKKFYDRAPRIERVDKVGDMSIIDNGWKEIPLGIIAAAGVDNTNLKINSGRRFEDIHRGSWDPHARLVEQDLDGVCAEVIYPSIGMALCDHPDFDYKHACFTAYNSWLAEYCHTHPERLVGVGQTAMRSVEDGINDIEAIKSLGLKGIMLPNRPAQEDYHHSMYDPFWAALADSGLPASFHVLTGGDQYRGPKLNNFISAIHTNQMLIGALILGGVFERHPGIKVVCVEADAGWVPHYIYRIDTVFERHQSWLPTDKLSKSPGEYFHEHIYLTIQNDEVALQQLGQINPERLMWGNDFPHSDSTWPYSQELLDKQTKQVSAAHLKRVIYDNCAELYHLYP